MVTRLSASTATALAVCLVTAALFVRGPDRFLSPKFWAEDGAIFFKDVYEMGVAAVIQPYAGYSLAFPRIVALASSAAPIRYLPAIYSYGAWLACVFVAVHIVLSRLPASPVVRFLMAIAIVASPINREVLMTLTNAQWILALSLVVLFTSEDPPSDEPVWLDRFLIGFVGLTGPFILIFLPLFVVYWAAKPSRHRLVLLRIALVVAAIQAVQVAFGWPRPDFAESWLSTTGIEVLGARLGGIFGGSLIAIRPFMPYVGFAGVFVIYGWLLASALREATISRLLVVIAGPLALTSALLVSNPEELGGAGDRYFYLPTILRLWSLLLYRGRHTRLRNVLVVCSFPVFLSRLPDPKLADDDWPAAARCLETQPSCTITVNLGTTFTTVRSRRGGNIAAEELRFNSS